MGYVCTKGNLILRGCKLNLGSRLVAHSVGKQQMYQKLIKVINYLLMNVERVHVRHANIRMINLCFNIALRFQEFWAMQYPFRTQQLYWFCVVNGWSNTRPISHRLGPCAQQQVAAHEFNKVSLQEEEKAVFFSGAMDGRCFSKCPKLSKAKFKRLAIYRKEKPDQSALTSNSAHSNMSAQR